MIIVSSGPEAGTGMPAQDNHPEDQGGAGGQLGSYQNARHFRVLRVIPRRQVLLHTDFTSSEADGSARQRDQKRVPARQLRTTIPKISPAHAMNWAANCTLAMLYLRVSAGP
jgi:hypothetical protein